MARLFLQKHRNSQEASEAAYASLAAIANDNIWKVARCINGHVTFLVLGFHGIRVSLVLFFAFLVLSSIVSS